MGLLVLIFAIALNTLPLAPAHSSTQPGSPVPVIQDQMLGIKPNWAQITLRSLPAILASGSFEAPADLIRELGYDPSRLWQAGQTADEYMLLGDFQDSFQLQRFSLADIGAVVGLDWEALRLADLALVGWQTIADLVQAIPDLADLPVQAVQPIADLLQGQVEVPQTIADVVQNEVLAELSLGELNLEQYDLGVIPGLIDAPLETFQDWQQSVIDQIPGLADVPFANFPNPIVEQGVVVGMVDVVFGPAEGDRTNTISGSYVEGFNVPCQTDCAHLEMAQPELERRSRIKA